MSIRAGLRAWKHIAALLIAAAIVLAAPYGIAVAVRSAIASIILWKAETAISRIAADVSAPLPAFSTGPQATTGPGAAASADRPPPTFLRISV
jgi:hypothetical protein